MENFLKIFEDTIKLLEVLSWPLTVLIIFFFLKPSIVELLLRIKGIRHNNTEIDIDFQKKSKEGSDSIIDSLIDGENSEIRTIDNSASNSNIDRAINLFSSETFDLIRNAIKTETTINDISQFRGTELILFNYSSLLYLIIHFNKIYSSIFGSQIKILLRLNSNQIETKASLKNYYDKAKQSFPNTFRDYPYDDYLEFLTSYNLVKIENQNIFITHLGKDFIKFIIESGLPSEKYN